MEKALKSSPSLFLNTDCFFSKVWPRRRHNNLDHYPHPQICEAHQQLACIVYRRNNRFQRGTGEPISGSDGKLKSRERVHQAHQTREGLWPVEKHFVLFSSGIKTKYLGRGGPVDTFIELRWWFRVASVQVSILVHLYSARSSIDSECNITFNAVCPGDTIWHPCVWL